MSIVTMSYRELRHRIAQDAGARFRREATTIPMAGLKHIASSTVGYIATARKSRERLADEIVAKVLGWPEPRIGLS